MNTNFAFEKKGIVEHLISKVEDITPIRLQKSLYFLFAYYGATYGQMNSDSEETGFIEGGRFSKELFPASFEAWKYGPVDTEIYYEFKDDELEGNELVGTSKEEKEVIKFMDDLIKQFNDVGDFGLVERSHQDESWKAAYEKGYNEKIDNDELIKEYTSKYVGN